MIPQMPQELIDQMNAEIEELKKLPPSKYRQAKIAAEEHWISQPGNFIPDSAHSPGPFRETKKIIEVPEEVKKEEK